MSEREIFYLRLSKGLEKKSLLISQTALSLKAMCLELLTNNFPVRGNPRGRAARFVILGLGYLNFP